MFACRSRKDTGRGSRPLGLACMGRGKRAAAQLLYQGTSGPRKPGSPGLLRLTVSLQFVQTLSVRESASRFHSYK